MRTITRFSLILFMSLLAFIGCEMETSLIPDSTSLQDEKSIPGKIINHPVQQFTASNAIDMEMPPPFPIIVPHGKKFKISTTFYTNVTSENPYVNGRMETSLNALWTADMTGPVFGEFVITMNNGAQWKGDVHGKRHKIDETTWKWTGHFVGKGFGESIQGMKIIFLEEIESYEPQPMIPVSILNGKVITK